MRITPCSSSPFEDPMVAKALRKHHAAGQQAGHKARPHRPQKHPKTPPPKPQPLRAALGTAPPSPQHNQQPPKPPLFHPNLNEEEGRDKIKGTGGRELPPFGGTTATHHPQAPQAAPTSRPGPGSPPPGPHRAPQRPAGPRHSLNPQPLPRRRPYGGGPT